MALSSYSNNWGTTTTLESLNSEMMGSDYYFFSPQTELETELLGFCNGFGIDDNNNLNKCLIDDPFFTPNEFFHSNDDDRFLVYDDPPIISLPPEKQFIDPYPAPKRQKCYETLNNSVFAPSFFKGYAPISCPVPEPVFLPMPELIQAPEVVNFGGNYVETTTSTITSSGGVKRTSGNYVETTTSTITSSGGVKGTSNNNNEQASSSSVSAQTMAARQRRRKITEKTQELGKLIPGGNKMNTAEMLQSAFKYVKYLQASVSILQSMSSLEENKVSEGSMENLQVLLQSSTVQEKLCLEEKCLVPIEFVKSLAEQHGSKSEPSIRDDLNRLIQSETLGGR